MTLIPGSAVESAVIDGVQWLRLGIDAIGALVLGGGVAIAITRLAARSVRRLAPDFTAVRLSLARYLAEQNFDVWNLSLLGTGRSLKPLKNAPDGWTLD